MNALGKFAAQNAISNSNTERRRLLVAAVKDEAVGVKSLKLKSPIPEEELPPWSSGAHLELLLPSGKVRHYSLCGTVTDRAHYTIAVQCGDINNGGGAAEIHATIQAGASLDVRGPFNNFELIDAHRYLFIAGGIGITPILSMIAAVDAIRPWQLVYGGRTRKSMAFVDRISGYDARRVTVVPEDIDGRPDIAGILANLSLDTVVYCCGPEGLLNAVEKMASEAGLKFHFERFAARTDLECTGSSHAFEVELARSGRTVLVEPGRSILSVVREVVPNVQFSCESGICGQCETRVLSGEVEHRDSLLSADEKAAGRSMMICVSRCKGKRLVLDL